MQYDKSKHGRRLAAAAIAGLLGAQALLAAARAQGLPAPPGSPAPVNSYQYDALGNPTQATQAPGVAGFGFVASAAYDALGRRKTATDARSGLTQFGYDGLDRMLSVTDPRSLATQYPRNGLGDPTQLVSPDTGTASLGYDAAGNLTSRTDARGVRASYSYDALNRLAAVVYTQSGQPSQAFGWTYDQTGPGFSNGIGRLTSIGFPAGSAQYAYDAQGHMVGARQQLNGASLSTAYGYDAAGHLTSITYPSGRVLSIAYTGGLPRTISLAEDAGSAARPLLTQIEYAPFGAVRSWNWALAGGPQAYARVFDTSGRLVRYPLGSLVRDLSYDAADRITAYTHYDAASGTAQPALDQHFGYDELGRLTSVTAGANSWSFGYDANGNRTVLTLDGSTSSYSTAPTSNRLTAIANPSRSFGYDNAGNTTGDGSYSASYDLSGRLATLALAGLSTTYAYDNAGRRVSKANANGTTLFVYAPTGQLLGEYDQAGHAVAEYVWLGELPVAVFLPDPAGATAPQVYFIHADHLDAPRVVVDDAGRLRWRWLAEPFGTDAPETNPASLGDFVFNPRLPGQYADAESGLFHNGWRSYDPSIGRYAQSDPIGLAGGINTYTYVGGNPVSRVDPDGRLAFVIPFIPAIITGTDLAIGAALGVGVYAIDRIFSNSNRPPPGSVPISGSPWSGDHGGIKGALGLGGRDSVFIDPEGNVWVQHPDGSWSNEGPASDYTGSGKASGRRSKDRDEKNCS